MDAEWRTVGVSILVAFVVPVISGIFKLIGYWRADKTDASKARRDRDAAEMEADTRRRGMLDAEQVGIFDRLERDRDRLEARVKTLETEAADAWGLVHRMQAERSARVRIDTTPSDLSGA